MPTPTVNASASPNFIRLEWQAKVLVVDSADGKLKHFDEG